MSLVQPYGFVAVVGKLSSIGTRAGSPYTVAEELNTSFRQPAFSIACSTDSSPCRLLS